MISAISIKDTFMSFKQNIDTNVAILQERRYKKDACTSLLGYQTIETKITRNCTSRSLSLGKERVGP